MCFQKSIYLIMISLLLACETADQVEDPPIATIQRARPRPVVNQQNWSKKLLVEGGQMGLLPKLAISSGTNQIISVAYWSNEGFEAEKCTGINVMDPPLAVRWTLKYAQWDGENWVNESIDQPILLGNPPGLDLIFNDQNQPMISVLSGKVVAKTRYCGGSDLGIYQRKDTMDIGKSELAMSEMDPQTFNESQYLLKKWDLELAAIDSKQAASGDPASDYGDVVGYWPSISQSAQGQFLVAYQDVHGGGLQRDDLARADLEVVMGQNGAWQHEAVDFGEGAGIRMSTGFLSDGTALILYEIPIEAAQAERNRQGIWLAFKKDGTWQKIQVAKGPQKTKASLLVHQDQILIAYYDLNQKLLNLLSYQSSTSASLENIDTWEKQQLGDLRYNEGLNPSLAIDQMGRIMVAWYRCSSVEDDSCRPSEDAVVFAWQKSVGAKEWNLEIVEQGEEGSCGLSPSLQINQNQEAILVWQCFRRSEDGSGFESRLESAFRLKLEE